MRRAIRFAVLSLLLLFMQHEGYVHPISHLAARVSMPRETFVSAPAVDADCLECALLASGAHATVGGTIVALADGPVVASATSSYRSRAADAAAWFDSRAPPALL